MQVFHEAIQANGGPLPLLRYLQPEVGHDSLEGGDGAEPPNNNIAALLNCRVDRRSFFESVLDDKDFAVLTTFMMSGVPADAVRPDDGATALHIAAAGTLDLPKLSDGPRDDTSNGSSFPCKNQLIISFLIDNGGNVDVPMLNEQGQTPLMMAALRQNLKAMQLLLSKGANLMAQDAQGRTVLSYAATYPHVMETLRLWMGEEALYAAAVHERLLHTVCRVAGNSYAALYLIEQLHLDVDAHDDIAASAAMAHARQPSREVPAPMYPSGHDVSLSHLPTPPTNASPMLVGGGASEIYVGDARGGPLLPPLSARFPTATSSASRSIRSISQAPVTPVQGSSRPPSRGSDVDVFPTLHSRRRESGALGSSSLVDFSSTPRTFGAGDTPLHCAVSTADVGLVRALLSKGADVHAVNAGGVTPVQLAQSCSAVGLSWRQGWRNVCSSLLQPHSPAAARARQQRRDRQRGWDPDVVRRLLTAYSKAGTTASREKLLQESPAQYVWQLCTRMDVVRLLAAITLPHLFYYICCHFTSNFYVLLAILPFLYASYVGTLNRERAQPCRRPLGGLGWFMGFVVGQGLCLPLFTTHYYYKYYSFNLEEHHAFSWWLMPSTVGVVVLTAYLILFSSPGVVTSTEGQRKGIYASLRNTKAGDSKEVLYGIDLRTMVRKPLRAQFSPQLQCVVLRYDHFCPYLSTVIGGGNHRLFLLIHLLLLSLLSCFYFYAQEYRRLMGGVAEVARTSATVVVAAAAAPHRKAQEMVDMAAAAALDRVVLEKFATAPFATAERRLAYMYSQVILPGMILMVLYVVYLQLCSIARNLTYFDLTHAEAESSVYCFTIGDKVYSLYDRGTWANLGEFFGCTSLTQRQYRVPKLSAHLQRLVEDHQRWQLTDGACCDDQGHSHAPQSVALPEGSPHGPTAVESTREEVGPAEWGEDETGRAQLRRVARQQEVLAAAAAAAGVTGINERLNEAMVARQQQQDSHLHPPASSRVPVNDGDGNDGGVGADDETALTMCLFQEMVRNGSIEVGRAEATDPAATDDGGGSGVDAATQKTWEKAVGKAQQMYRFYLQTLGGDDSL